VCPSGLEYARTHGTKSGKSIGRPKAVFNRARAIELPDAGLIWRQIAAELGTRVRAVRRVFRVGMVAKPAV